MSNQVIIEAIKNKRVLSVTYKDATRLVIPHAYGVDKNGGLKLRGYQIEGSDASETPTGWRLFNESDITGLTVTAQSFTAPSAGYKAGDKTLATVIAEL